MVTLYTDYYFHIGAQHLTSGVPCQDYAIAKSADDYAYAIVSDGCSGGRHTDVGSRLVSLSTARALEDYWKINQSIDQERSPMEIDVRQGLVLASMQEALGLISEDMLATCVYAYISPHGGLIHIVGDGVVALKYRDGSIRIMLFEWQRNMPYYPAYKNGLLEIFIDAHGGNVASQKLRSYDICIDSDDEALRPMNALKYTISEGMSGITIPLSQEEIESEIEFVAVFSDGISQIDGLGWRGAIQKLLTFKNTTGSFAKRRMIRTIKDVQKKDKGPIDDIAYAVIRIASDPEEVDDDKDTEKDRGEPGWSWLNYFAPT